MKTSCTIILSACVAGATSLIALAQDNAGAPPPGGPGGPGGRAVPLINS